MKSLFIVNFLPFPPTRLPFGALLNYWGGDGRVKNKSNISSTTYTAQQQYSLQCSTYQMGILLLFNENNVLTLEEIQTATALTKPVLLTTLAVYYFLGVPF
jgi:hypothetical protein